MTSFDLKSIVIHPILFAIYPVLFLYSYNIHALPLKTIYIPILVIPLFVFSIWLVVRYVLKNGKKAGLVVSLIIILITFYGHIFNVSSNSEDEVSKIIPILLLGVFFVLLGVGVYYFVRTKRNLEKPTMVVNVIAISMIAIVLVSIGSSKIEIYSMEEANPIIEKFEPIAINIQALPDIYYILLDGYSNYRILKETLGYDNQEFITALTDRGFLVHTEYTNSNYEFTDLTTSSILGMDYVHNLAPEGLAPRPTVNALYKTIDNNAVMQNLKSIGYTNISFDSGYWATEEIEISDEILCANPLFNNRLIVKAKDTTIVTSIKILDEKFQEMADDLKRKKILCEFSELPKIRDRVEGPLFVFTHIVAPHPHWVFDSNGKPVNDVLLYKSKNIENRKKAYIDQLEFTNKKTIEAIDEILAKTDKLTIIIIQSDHGTRIVDEDRTDDESLLIRMGNFNAFYVPDDLKDSFKEPITPVNTFRKLFNSVFGTSYEILEDRVFIEGNEVKNWKETKKIALKQIIN